MAEEVWKDIQFFEGMYQVSTLGRVRSVNRYDRRGHFWEGKIKSQRIDKYGYYLVKLYKEGKEYTFQIHRLVAMAFIAIPNHLKEFSFDDLKVDHIDTHTENNTVENLRWVTEEENRNNPLTIQHRIEAGTYKPVLQMTKDELPVQFFDNIREAAKANGINPSTLTNGLKKNKYFVHKGYKFVYYS